MISLISLKLTNHGFGILYISISEVVTPISISSYLIYSLHFKFLAIIILTEKFLNESNDIFHIPGYNSFSLYKDFRGGGVEIFVLDPPNSTEYVTFNLIKKLK